MYYEARIAAVVFYYARVKKEEKKRKQACLIKLNEAQYMQVIHLFLTIFHMTNKSNKKYSWFFVRFGICQMLHSLRSHAVPGCF
jgi:hypothetical protein